MPQEATNLSPLEEALFQKWVEANAKAPGVGNYDSPDSHYDMRGFFKDKGALAQWKPGDHFPDTFKQHGHPTFSQESQYSKGASDGGMWVGENFLPQPPMVPSHPVDQRELLLKMLKQR